jgi:hypothetical protein
VGGLEDATIPLNISASLADMDGSETLSIVIEGLPEGTQLSAGVNNGDGSWTLSGPQLHGLTLTPPGNWSGDMPLTATAHARETSNGSIAVATTYFEVHVTSAADAPAIAAAGVFGFEDAAVPLDLHAALLDTDGSERLSIIVHDLPEGFSLSVGSALNMGSWEVPADRLHGLSLHAPADWNGTLDLRLEALSVEIDGNRAVSTAAFKVTVAAVGDAPVVEFVSPASVAAGSAAADALDDVGVTEVDGDAIAGATITLSGAHPGDKLEFDGFELRSEGGRTMIGDTGIEIVGGGYDPSAGKLTLSGNAAPGAYAAVLDALVIGTDSPIGLLEGMRSVAASLHDETGAVSAMQSAVVEVGSGSAEATNASVVTNASAFADLLLIGDAGIPQTVSWAEHVDAMLASATDADTTLYGAEPATTPASFSTFDFVPASETGAGVYLVQAELERTHWG